VPFQAGDDALHRPAGAGAVEASADVQGTGQALFLLQHRVVHPVEEVLEGAAHVAEIFRGAEDDGIGGEHVLGARLEGRDMARRHPFDVRVAGTPQHRLGQGAGVHGRAVGDDQQLFAGHGSVPVDSHFSVAGM
jgi:hypothetical protein